MTGKTPMPPGHRDNQCRLGGRSAPRFVLLWLAFTACPVAAQDVIEVSGRAQQAGLELIALEPGTYRRGFDRHDHREHRFHMAHPFSNRQEFRDESKSHLVELTRPFAIGRTEVTVGQFRRFVDATGYVTDAERNGGGLGCFPDQEDYVDRFHKDPAITWRTPGFEQGDQHPVVAVSWKDATAFCRWLNDDQDSAFHFRLPSEAEWEYACRAGTTSWYSWGEDPDQAYAHANVADAALETAQPGTTRYQRAVKLKSGEGDGVVFTAKVGQYRPNAWGLFDMHGNVWEWCQDRWSANVYNRYFDGVDRRQWRQVKVTDPLFEEATDQHRYGDWRVLRGGGWTCAPAAVRSSIRTFAEAADATVYTGFRVVAERREDDR